MLPNVSAASIVLLLAGCATISDREASRKQWSQGIVVATEMCATDGSSQHTKDPEGFRAYCAREEIVGSHLRKCVCRDEGQAVEERDESQQYLRNAAATKQVLGGG